MQKREKFTWLISRKSFIELLGAEYEIMKRSESGVLVKFYISAISLLAILIISILSIFYAMKMLFNMLHIEVLMAGFVSLLFVSIYVFMLNIFSKEETKTSGQETGQPIRQRRPGFSDLVRIIFIILMAFLISKPVEVFLFQESLVAKVGNHKQVLLKQYETKVLALNKPDRDHLDSTINLYKNQLSNYNSPTLEAMIANETQKLNSLVKKEGDMIAIAANKINGSSFFIYRCQLVSGIGLAWAICALVISLFLLPFILIYTISPDDAYYRFKRMSESRIILEEYRAFLVKYSHLFLRKYQEDISHFSDFEDPPFNKVRKAKGQYQVQEDFLKKYT